MATLVELSGDQRVFALGATTTLGRDRGCTVELVDPFVSRVHAEISRTPEGRLRLVDRGSRHGTFVRGQRIQEHLLSEGDEIIVGASRLVFREADSAAQAGSLEMGEQALPIVDRLIVNADERFPAAAEVSDPRALRRSYDQLRAAYEVARSLSGAEDIDAVLARIVDVVLASLPADRVSILLLDPSSQQPIVQIAKQRTGTGAVVISKTVVHEVVATRTGLIVADVGTDARLQAAHSMLAQGVRSAMYVPMIYHDEILGVIHTDSTMATHVFEQSDLAMLSTIAGQAALAVRTAILSRRVERETRRRVLLQRFLSPNVADGVMSGRLLVDEAGEIRDVTVMFCDIRGFTSLSEGMSPGDVVDLLNRYYEAMVNVLFRHGGTLDKYIGDALMALFGAPVAFDDAPLAAAACSLDMLATLVGLNQTSGGPPLAIGIGIHTGPAVCGAIGSSKTRQYTAIGDTVNTASRLCSLAMPGQIVLSESTVALAAGRIMVEPLPATPLKGKKKPVPIFALTGLGAQA